MEIAQAGSGALTPGYTETVSAFDALVSRSKTIYKQDFAPNGVNNWIFEVTPKFDLVITNVADEGRDTVGAFSLSWRGKSDPDIASMTPIKSRLLAARRSSGKPSFPHLALLSPNGNFLIIARYLKTLSENGDASDGVGSIESWDVGRLLQREMNCLLSSCLSGRSQTLIGCSSWEHARSQH
jgi:hypothetical protein